MRGQNIAPEARAVKGTSPPACKPPMWGILWMLIAIDIHNMKTIQMTIDEPLLRAVDRLSKARKTTRSAFIRYAVEAELRREQIQIREAQDAAGYARYPVEQGEFDIWEKEQDWGPE